MFISESYIKICYVLINKHSIKITRILISHLLQMTSVQTTNFQCES